MAPRPAPRTKPKRGPRYLGTVAVPLTVEEREECRAAAVRDSRPLSAWMRLHLLIAARGGTTEIKP